MVKKAEKEIVHSLDKFVKMEKQKNETRNKYTYASK
jgi:hypothetical protein